MLYAQSPQDVWTWHNDNNRTGWQSHEMVLSADPNSAGYIGNSKFGLLWQWPVDGFVFAQPLAVILQRSVGSCGSPCSLVFVATEQDKLYAFNAASPLSAVWTFDLANNGRVQGTYLTCSDSAPPDPPCPKKALGPNEGVTGTPVIDMGTTHPPTLYVTAAVNVSGSINFYLYAIDITTGTPWGSPLANNPIAIQGIVPGQSPDPDGTNSAGDCTSDYPGNGGQINFEYHHIQRSALLLRNGTVYVAFSGGGGNDVHGETSNGWMFGYSFNFANNTFSQTAVFNSTPYGTGGGIWQAGAGPASDGTYIYATTANGTLFDPTLTTTPLPSDIGDSLVKLDPSNLHVLDFFAPPDVLTDPSTSKGVGYCKNDFDFGSGGVMLFPDAFYNNNPNLMVNADKESYLTVTDRTNLGKYSASGNNYVQYIQTPLPPGDDPLQGYWGSPAYWKYTPDGVHYTYMLYYAATTENSAATPKSINAYQLLTSGTAGPIPAAFVSTPTLFCPKSPTPSVSSNGTKAGTGIVWAIEHQFVDNPTDCTGADIHGAALHAFDATNVATKLFNGRNVTTPIGNFTNFSTPTIFQHQVYVGAQKEVDVYGLCNTAPSGHCEP